MGSVKLRFKNAPSWAKDGPSSDYFENIGEGAGFPPAPIVTSNAPAPAVQNVPKQDEMFDMGPQAANGVLGGSFGSFF